MRILKITLGFFALVICFGLVIWLASSLRGKPVSLGRYEDLNSSQQVELSTNPSKKGIALVFYTLTCPCARDSFGIVKRGAADLKNLDYDVYVISTDTKSTREKIQNYFKLADLGLPILVDQGWNLVKQYDVKTAAEIVILDRKAEIKYSGAIYSEDQEFLTEWILDVREGKTPRHVHGKGLGCALDENDPSKVWTTH